MKSNKTIWRANLLFRRRILWW